MLFFVKGPTAAAHVRARGPDEGRAASGRTAAAHGCRRAAAVAAHREHRNRYQPEKAIHRPASGAPETASGESGLIAGRAPDST